MCGKRRVSPAAPSVPADPLPGRAWWGHSDAHELRYCVSGYKKRKGILGCSSLKRCSFEASRVCQLLSCYFDQTPWARLIRSGSLSPSRQGGRKHGVRDSWESCLQLQAGSREIQPAIGGRLAHTRSADELPAGRPCLLNCPTASLTRDEVLKCPRLWGASHSNHHRGEPYVNNLFWIPSRIFQARCSRSDLLTCRNCMFYNCITVFKKILAFTNPCGVMLQSDF